MDRLAEKATKWFGSAPFILFHVVWFTLWMLAHFFYKFDPDWSILTIIVSLEAIFLCLFILRGDVVQSERNDRFTKQAARDSKEDLELSATILKKLKKG